MTKPLKPVNKHLNSVTIQEVETHKLISTKELERDLKNLREFTAETNANNFFGNPFLYHYQFKNLLKCRRKDGKTIYDIWNDADEWSKLIEQTKLRNRGGRTAAGNVFECFRINLGAVVMFKATTAKYLYRKYSATAVLDPTAGWGGRMLAADSLGIDYTGIDTNIEMQPAYQAMISWLDRYHASTMGPLFESISSSKLHMIWQDCLSVDFGTINYDFVLTSPPYVNLELYQHMMPWATDQEFYQDFFIPLYYKCRKNIKPGGHIAFNVSPGMYDSAVKLGLPPCDEEEDLLQQMGQKKNRKRQDKIYVWRC